MIYFGINILNISLNVDNWHLVSKICMMPLPYVGSKMFTAFQGRVPIKFDNLTDKETI